MSREIVKDDPFTDLGYQAKNSLSEGSPLPVNRKSDNSIVASPTRSFPEKSPGNYSSAFIEAPTLPGRSSESPCTKVRAHPESPGAKAAAQERIIYGVSMSKALTEHKPQGGCTDCGGCLDWLSERASNRSTKVFWFCTNCGVIAKVRRYRG